MSVLIAATYIALSGFIVYLLVLLSARSNNREVDVKGTILATEELQKHALEIAKSHPVGRSSKSLHWLVRRLNDNYGFITGVYKELNADIKESFPTAPAAEWLLDNFYIIEEQVKLIRRNLSRGQYSRLPALKKGYLKEYPRVYAIALEIIAHSNGNIDEKAITAFVQAYQAHMLLSMGELWAIPLMLRIALVESIRNTCESIRQSRTEWHRAEELVSYIVSHESDEQQIDIALARYLNESKEMKPSFVEHLLQRLRKQGKGLPAVTALLDLRLQRDDSSTGKIAAIEHQLQAEMQVAIGNAITGLRLISDLDWSEIFELLSRVEQILRQDPNGIYSLMDFESRDYYRHEVEKLARSYETSEIHVADKAVECAKQGADSSPHDHVGYYLVGRGRRTLLHKLGKTTKKKLTLRPFIAAAGKPKHLYTAMIIFLTAFSGSYFTYYVSTRDSTGSTIWPLVTALLVILPCMDFAIHLTNTIISHIYRPTMLPKLELTGGIPESLAAFVIIPALLTSPGRAGELLRQMEVYFLANREQNLFFGLLGDFKDAPAEEQDGDDAIIQTVTKGVDELNRKYSGEGRSIFYYTHRKRSCNTGQKRWMGWERKRGAIIEFNRLLRGERDLSFNVISGDFSKLPRIRYVITLDADTSLPMGTAKKLIGTIAHPLNRAAVDGETGLVSEGYGLLQPRICVGIPSANRSVFSKVFAGQGGLDPYTAAVSDIYQDLFDEGIFTGKGVYDVDVFKGVLDSRIPDNTVLSHDLIEGCHLRAGLVSDIKLVDGYPASYDAYTARQHRWVRGDWQLIPWLAKDIPDADGKATKNHLSRLSKWKIIDNMRRSLLYPALFILLLAGAGLLPGNRLVWIGFALLVTASPIATRLLNSLFTGYLGNKRSKTNPAVISSMDAAIYQSALLFMFIPHQAYIMTDAIIRTVYRVFFSHTNMLEWVTAADAEASAKNSVGSYFKKMWFSIAAAAVLFLLALPATPATFVTASAVALLWLISPLVAYRISKPVLKRRVRISDNDTAMLRQAARKTWRYFEDFAGEEDNYLPPDNYQLDPPKGVAHRTSPTNIGLLLLSILSACDMGYIGSGDMVDRLDKTIGTVEKLKKWKGHLYNWYDTVTLEMMRPLYISTVDSGNFTGYMMVVREGLKQYMTALTPQPSAATGFLDTLILTCDEKGVEIDVHIRQTLLELSGQTNMDLYKWSKLLSALDSWLKPIVCVPGGDRDSWAEKLSHMVRKYTDELNDFYPYVSQSPAILEQLGEQTAKSLSASASPEQLLQRSEAAVHILESAVQNGDKQARMLSDMFKQAVKKMENSVQKHQALILRISKIIDDTLFSPLFDHKRLLFAIGFNAEDGRLSKSYYDLLASEARQASYIAIARGEIDRRHWMRMGRKLTVADGGKVLVSWTGTMFEYLMPLLIMRNYQNTIFDETYSTVVRVQKKYGRQHRIPWGVSESGYSALDFNLNYQYKAFGVPELGLKRGLANDMVTSPYSSILALGIDPISVAENLRELNNLGMDTFWGYYEAIDFTPSRIENDTRSRIVKSYMAHHQGMCLAALNNFFNEDILQQRFHADPVVQSAELLLQEKIPEKVLYTKEYRNQSAVSIKRTEQTDGIAIRTYGFPRTLPPNVHLLSNGVYSVMVTDGGSGYSMDGNIAVTRWSPDYFVKNGFYIFIQNNNSNEVWSAACDPMPSKPEKYKVVFSPDKAEYIRREGNLESRLEITVSPEDNAEVRRISVTNHSNHTRIVELTSYFEAVLSPRHEDEAHPAFNKLFVRTEFVRKRMCLLATRRRRKEGQREQWLMHTMALDTDTVIGDMQYETDRMRFIGRNRSISDPEALEPDRPLGNSEGSVLDPVMCLRRRIRIEAGRTIKAAYTVASAHTRKQAVALAEKYNDYKASERVFELSWTRSQVENRYFGLDAGEVDFYLELAPFLLYGNSLKREYEAYIRMNTGAQQDLWHFGISGDLPVVLVVVNDNEDVELVRWALKGHEYWRMKGLTIDLVILINKKEGYLQLTNDQVRNAVSASHARELMDQYGGVFVRNAADMDNVRLTLLYTTARIVLKDSVDALKSSVREMRKAPESSLPVSARGIADIPRSIIVHRPPSDRKLLFFNGIGGFSADGKEYVIQLGSGSHTPLPWVNVIANSNFGFLVTESGGGYTWAENSREFKLTPWTNDPVTDRQGEIFYIGDLQQKRQWSLTPMPAGDGEPYTVRHGFGYTVFEHRSHGLDQTLTMFAALDTPVKICMISLANLTGQTINLSVTYYTRPVLGVDDNLTSPYIETWRDNNGILFAENKYADDFKGRLLFLFTDAKDSSVTCDRTAFMGLEGEPAKPRALLDGNLTGVTGAGLDPCAAIMGKVIINPEEEVKIVYILGSAADAKQAALYAGRFGNADAAADELDRVKAFWKDRLESIRLHTPDDSFDIIMNGWLSYQTIACRMWGRTGYYQAGGAYGFRDQLQDCMAVLNTWPDLTRNQILLHASRQFIEGDVQHWWHAERGKGVRTRFSDDLLWLAYVTAEYVEKTGDATILAEQAPFLEGSALNEGEDEKYEEPVCSGQSASLYEHCTLAIDRSLATGPHGLPLIGSGDWNDGMSTVGNRGSGESVWLGWFLISILQKFDAICRLMDDFNRAEQYRAAAAELLKNIENEAWDGSWYRRAYFDNGMPLGSVQNSECMIDSISQSWSVISGVAKPHRMHEAMDAVQKYLVDGNEGIIKLLTPPFDKGELQPGYIKGYVPGVRENGGQYTHAAVWVVLAFAKLRLGDRASELFHMLNPVNHTRTDIEYSRYKTEPYVMAADVYAIHPHTGRGGWTWYTGTAGWMYKVGLESIAGFRKAGGRLYINPCIPKSWSGFEIYYRTKTSVYRITVRNPDSVSSGVAYIAADGKPCTEGYVNIAENGFHCVEVIMGSLLLSEPAAGLYATGSNAGKS